MEPKTGSRTIKKSAGGGVLGDRRKSRQKKRKEKRKASVKGTESTDVPSPELDSEVPLEGEATNVQDGRSSPVTRFPQLTSQSSVSLTTQTSTPPPILVTSSSHSRKLSLAGQPSSSSAPTTRSALPASPPFLTTAAAAPSASQLDGVVARVASLNIKQRSSKSRSKAQGAKSSGKSSRARGSNAGPGKASQASAASSSTTSISTKAGQNSAGAAPNESLRWEMALEDVERERERLAVYKMNRRKRYLAAAQAKGLGWAMNYNSQSAVTPVSEDSGVETGCGSPGMSASASVSASASGSGSGSGGAYIDFSSMQTLRPIPAHRGLQEAFVEC